MLIQPFLTSFWLFRNTYLRFPKELAEIGQKVKKMDLVGGYGSGSDDECEVKSVNKSFPEAASVKVAPSVISNAPQLLPQKKIKKLDITFLPPEIQAALARGDSTRDSDDEDDINVSHSATTKTNNQPAAENPLSSLLLGMLPAPKSKEESYNTSTTSRIQVGNVPTSSNSVDQASSSTKAPAPKSAFSFGYTTVEKKKVGTVKSDQTTASDSTSTKSSFVDVDTGEKAAPVLPWFTEEPRRPSAYSTDAAAIVGRKESSIGASSYGFDSVPTKAASVPPPPRQLSYEEYLQQNQAIQQEQSELPSHKKRKDRDFELQLMSGDLSGLQNAPVQDITVQHQWNEQAYTEQQQREQEVQRGFGIGVNKSLMMVTKQQSRKHQLSSLAMKAAETELAMLEKRGNRNLTKSETQGKYGW